MKTVEAVLFDLDGTLVDTAADLADTLNEFLQQYNKPGLPFATIRPHVSDGTPGLLKLGFNLTTSHPMYANHAAQLRSIYQKHFTQKSQLFAGMSQVLDNLTQQNIPWGIVTNKPKYFTDPLVQYLGLTYCQCCISGDTLTLNKPHPAPLLLAAEQLQVVASDCIYIGDAERDILAGHRAGMRTVAALYGYIRPDVDPYSWHADHYIQDPLEILDLL